MPATLCCPECMPAASSSTRAPAVRRPRPARRQTARLLACQRAKRAQPHGTARGTPRDTYTLGIADFELRTSHDRANGQRTYQRVTAHQSRPRLVSRQGGGSRQSVCRSVPRCCRRQREGVNTEPGFDPERDLDNRRRRPARTIPGVRRARGGPSTNGTRRNAYPETTYKLRLR